MIYEKFDTKDCPYDEKYKIYFENKSIRSAFEKLLKYECQECLRRIEQKKASKKNSNNVASSKDESQKVSETSGPNKDRQHKNSLKELSVATTNSNDNSVNQALGGGQKDDNRVVKGDSTSLAERIVEDTQGLLSAKEVASITFNDVFGLKNHLNYIHKLKLCDLCLTHNKLFPFEYSYYDNSALRKHMREGEPKTSHRGHPNCALCHNTFFNNDELILHMSREHFHCHLCGRHDSNMCVYFLDYDGLREHFKAKHYLCERDHCRHEQFTSAFDNRIDYQIHLVQVHGNPSTTLSRQERTITLDSAPHRARDRDMSPTRSLRQSLPPNAAIVTTGNLATANNSRLPRPESMQLQLRQQRLPTRAEFPALGQNSSYSTSQTVQTGSSQSGQSSAQSSNTARTSLRVNTTISQRLVAGPSSMRGSFVRTMGGGYRPPEQLTDTDFPPLPEQPKPKASKKSKAKQNDPARRNDNRELTLEQLISNSLTLSNRKPKLNGKKTSSKGGSNKTSKNVKQKTIKIQL